MLARRREENEEGNVKMIESRTTEEIGGLREWKRHGHRLGQGRKQKIEC